MEARAARTRDIAVGIAVALAAWWSLDRLLDEMSVRNDPVLSGWTLAFIAFAVCAAVIAGGATLIVRRNRLTLTAATVTFLALLALASTGLGFRIVQLPGWLWHPIARGALRSGIWILTGVWVVLLMSGRPRR